MDVKINCSSAKTESSAGSSMYNSNPDHMSSCSTILAICGYHMNESVIHSKIHLKIQQILEHE